MELRLPEPGAGNSAQSSEQKALQEERLSREMLVAEPSTECECVLPGK